MQITADKSAKAIAIALISLVVTQIIYITLFESGADINRPLIWTVEAILYLTIVVCAFVPLVRNYGPTLAWAALILSGLFNVIQLGMGITMFPPLQEGGELMETVFSAVLGSAFFLYFAGKLLFGFAAAQFGWVHMKSNGPAARIVGGVAILTGVLAMGANVLAMAMGMDLLFPAGATGTAATLLIALTLGTSIRTRDG